jgi:hypothetical protein
MNKMADDKQPTEPDDRRWLLTLVLGATLSNSLSVVGLLPGAESVFVGWTVAFLVGYWISPRPQTTFVFWMLERLGFLLCLCLAIFKIPLLLKRAMPFTLAYGISIMVFIGVFIAWLRYRKRYFF